MTRVLLCLALGAMTTIVVALACAAWSDPNRAWPIFLVVPTPDQGHQATSTQICFGHTRINRMVVLPVISPPRVESAMDWSFQFEQPMRSESRTGWPLRALRCHTDRQVTVRHGLGHVQNWNVQAPIAGALAELEPWPNINGAATWRALPYQPLWIGFVLDVLFYALLGMVVMQGPRWWRQVRRRRRGLCPACGYDLRGRGADHHKCPECGFAVVT